MDKVCCFSGHRNIPMHKAKIIFETLQLEIENLIKQGVDTFISGGARGFDCIAACIVVALKDVHPQIKLVFALPCKDQAKFWKKEDIALYNQLLKKADKIIYTSENYYNGCMHVRNRFMVDNSSYCICYLSQEKGGTAYTVNYAKKSGCKVINVFKND